MLRGRCWSPPTSAGSAEPACSRKEAVQEGAGLPGPTPEVRGWDLGPSGYWKAAKVQGAGTGSLEVRDENLIGNWTDGGGGGGRNTGWERDLDRESRPEDVEGRRTKLGRGYPGPKI